MALCIFNPTTLENRLASAEQIAAFYASPEPEDDESSPPPMHGFSDDDGSEGGISNVPPLEDQAAKDRSAPAPRQNGRTSIVLGDDEVLIDWETHLYDFATQQVVPIYIPLSQQLEEFKQHLLGEVAKLRQTLGSHIETVESRIAMLEATVSATGSPPALAARPQS